MWTSTCARDPPERGRTVEPGEVVEGGEELRPRGGGGDAGGVAQVVERGLGERPDHQPRADRPRPEPRRLLGGADEDAGAAAKRDGRLEREHGAERAVVAPAVRDGVDVRAGGDDRAVAGRQRPQVPVRIERDGEARLAPPTPRRGACAAASAAEYAGRSAPPPGASAIAHRSSSRAAIRAPSIASAGSPSIPMEWYFRDMHRRWSSDMSVTLLSHAENRPAGGAQVLDRVVALLGALSESGELPPGELAERCDLPASTTYRLIADLEQHGLVTRAGRRGTTLGLWILELARSVEDRLESELVEPAREVMEGLAHGHGETAILTAPGGTHAMCLASVESDHHAMRLSYDRWRTAPMHLGASGKVLLAHLDDAHAERILADPPPHPAGGPQIPAATLRRQIAETRRDGYLVTDGELDGGRDRRRRAGARRARAAARRPQPRRADAARPGDAPRDRARGGRGRGRDRAEDRRAVTAEPVALRAPAGAPLPRDDRARRPHAHARHRRGDRARRRGRPASRTPPGRATPRRARRSRR